MDCGRRECYCSSEIAIDRAGDSYCSEACAALASGGGTEDSCACGHAGCATEDTTGRNP
jgi:hypothetical protein